MIANSEPILKEIYNSSFEFHLTGSRFFGWSTPLSDWDFFIQDTPKVKVWLKDNGFHACDKYYFGMTCGYDENTTGVWAKPFIHIQLQRNLVLKQFAQQVIYNTAFFANALRACSDEAKKADRRMIWNAVYTMFGQLNMHPDLTSQLISSGAFTPATIQLFLPQGLAVAL